MTCKHFDKAGFPLDRNVIVEWYDSSLFWFTAERLMRIYGHRFFFRFLTYLGHIDGVEFD